MSSRGDAPFDWLTRVDELLEEQVIPALDRVAQQMERAAQRAGDDGQVPDRDSYPFEFSTDVPANTTADDPVETTREIPYEGRIVALTVGWPAGANNLTGVQFRTESGERFFPRNKQDEYIAADDFTRTFNLRADVDKDSELVAEFVNNDTTHGHFINVVAEIEKKPEVTDGA